MKNTPTNEMEQFNMIRKIYLFYHPAEPGNAYIFLFAFGMVTVLVIGASMSLSKK